MRTINPWTLTLVLACTASAGWWVVTHSNSNVANAAPTVNNLEAPPQADAPATNAPPAGADTAPRSGKRLRCRRFEAPLNSSATLDTYDQTTEVGTWVAEQEGFEVENVDFEVAQKPTGYPQGWVQVCVSQPTPSR